ncbi:ORF2 [Simian adenovirus 16]|uniref:ORF2 n=1 Tax=Simian adenovirus 16 TaxID=1715778 RepID=A0A0M4NHM1_9ADEN|nr:ORF2 [Simian adenovirus 16]ALE30417.1 ORF2 [Simian adenovirus 16]
MFFLVEAAAMFERRPVFYSIVIPQPLLEYLHGCDVELHAFMVRVLPEFWRFQLLCLTPPYESAHAGGMLASLAPVFQVTCCVSAPGLTPNGELASLLAFDLHEVLLTALMVELRDRRVVPNLQMLRLLQVTQEVNLF